MSARCLGLIAALVAGAARPALAQAAPASWRARVSGDWAGSYTELRDEGPLTGRLRVVLVLTDSSVSGAVYGNDGNLYGELERAVVVGDSVITFDAGMHTTWAVRLNGDRLQVSSLAMGHINGKALLARRIPAKPAGGRP